MIVKTFNLPKYNIDEILRYMGSDKTDENSLELINSCILELGDLISPKVVYDIFSINICENFIDLGFMSLQNSTLTKLLKDCDKIVLFVSTIGLGIDRLIYKYGSVSPLKALCFQAIGSERIESLCDEFCLFINKEFKHTLNRFSPGYESLPLDMQKNIFEVLKPEKNIGLTLNDSLIMSPTKSVSAIIGIKNKNFTCEELNFPKCDKCDNFNCLYRRK